MLKHSFDPSVPRANFGRIPAFKGPNTKDENLATMKKALLVLVAIVMGGMVLSSCGSTHSCPAYSKVVKPAAERPC